MVEVVTSLPSSVDAHVNEYTSRTYRRVDTRPPRPDSDRRARRGVPPGPGSTATQQLARQNRVVLSEQRYTDIMRRVSQMWSLGYE
jgi:hypothetical protein